MKGIIVRKRYEGEESDDCESGISNNMIRKEDENDKPSEEQETQTEKKREGSRSTIPIMTNLRTPSEKYSRVWARI